MKNLLALCTALGWLAYTNNSAHFVAAGTLRDLARTESDSIPSASRAMIPFETPRIVMADRDGGTLSPHMWPAVELPNPVGTEFDLQWIKHALRHRYAGPSQLRLQSDKKNWISAETTALEIVSTPRQSDDWWAPEVDRRIRESLQQFAPASMQRDARVFCSSRGCLCYLKGSNESGQITETKVANQLMTALSHEGEWGTLYGIRASDVYYYFEGTEMPHHFWYLIYVLRS
jgi:hypothetical protein